MLKLARKCFFVFITTKLHHIEKSTENRMHERNSLGKKNDNSQSKGCLENRFALVYWTKQMDQSVLPKSTGLADALRL